MAVTTVGMITDRKMDPAVKEKWLGALRSGDYSKGRKELKDEDGSYCCLGVLCEIAVAEGVIPHYEDYACFPPDEVYDWAGLGEHKVHDPGVQVAIPSGFSSSGYYSWLSELNDDTWSGNDFSRIANVIEENL